MSRERIEFENDLTVYYSARLHKGMALELARVYGDGLTLKDLLSELDRQVDKYGDLMYHRETREKAGKVIREIAEGGTAL